jgi:hypothetical protein
MAGLTDLEVGINYEVALEVLGQSLQPMLRAIEDERKKAKPSEAYIQYCRALIAAVGDLQEELEPSDTDTVQRIFDNTGGFKLRG